MSVLLLVVVLLVVAIVLSRLTWVSLGERRSIKHHEQAMDVLRSLAGGPQGSEHPEAGEHRGTHVNASVDDRGFPAPAPAKAVPEAIARREETIRVLRAEPTGAQPFTLDPSEARPGRQDQTAPAASAVPPPPPAPAPAAGRPGGSEPAHQPVGVEARQGGAGSGPSWEPAHSHQIPADRNGEPARPAFVFIADDSGQPGPVTVPPTVADAIRSSARRRSGNGDGGADGHRLSRGGWGDGRERTGGDRWADGQHWGEEPAAGPTTLPSPPSIGDHDWSASSRSEARSRSRAGTRSRLWGRLRAPVHATGRITSGARHRVGSAGRPVPPDGDAGPDNGWLAEARGRGESTGESGKVTTVDVPTVTTADAVTAAPGPAIETTEGGDGFADTTAPNPEVSAGPPPVAERERVTGGVDGVDGVWPAFDAEEAERPRSLVGRAGRRRRVGLVAGLAAIVVVVVVVAGVLAATMSGSSKSNKAQPTTQASPPPAAAPAPPRSPLNLVSSDQNGSLYNVNSSNVVVSAVASGRVWLEVVAGTGPYGSVVWQGILTSGQTQTITNNAPVWIRIGAASNVTLSVNGGGVQLPQAPTTYNLTFSQGQT
jgi:hypothetical protein